MTLVSYSEAQQKTNALDPDERNKVKARDGHTLQLGAPSSTLTTFGPSFSNKHVHMEAILSSLQLVGGRLCILLSRPLAVSCSAFHLPWKRTVHNTISLYLSNLADDVLQRLHHMIPRAPPWGQHIEPEPLIGDCVLLFLVLTLIFVSMIQCLAMDTIFLSFETLL